MPKPPSLAARKNKPRLVNMCFDDEKVCFSPEHYKICDKGMCLRTNWYFPFGTELSVNLEVCDTPGKLRSIKCSGTVITCEKVPQSKTAYDVTLYFSKCLNVSAKALRSASRLIHVAG